MVQDSRADILALLQRLAAGDNQPYDLGLQLWKLSMAQVDPAGDWVYYPLWLLWGALTDWVEVKPAETAQAEAAMVEAAKGFLSVVGQEARERAYFDHWLYERLGYERPDGSSGT
jgi:hypothetical protein